MAALRRLLEERGHAVVVVAEGRPGADGRRRTDASGNKKLTDAGPWLRDPITSHFQAIGVELNLKYIDPSYVIRSVTANAHDSVYCVRLGYNAVHAAMSGPTEMLVGRWHGHFVHIPCHWPFGSATASIRMGPVD